MHNIREQLTMAGGDQQVHMRAQGLRLLGAIQGYSGGGVVPPDLSICLCKCWVLKKTNHRSVRVGCMCSPKNNVCPTCLVML